MLKLQKSSLILILTVVVLTAGCVSIYTLGYAPGTVWHKAEDVKSGTFGQNVGKGNYNFPDNIDVSKQVTSGTMFKVGSSEISSSQLKVNGSSLVVTSTGKVGIGTASPQANLEVKGGIYVEGASGDVNGDGTVDVGDARDISWWLNGDITFTKEQYAKADFNGDGKVTILDAHLIANYYVGEITLDDARNLVGKQAADKAIQTTYEGNVGIGTTSPKAKLDVRGGMYVEGASGDVNGDGTVDVGDARDISWWLNGDITFTKEQYAKADFNGDGKVTKLDAELIQRYDIGLITLDDARNLVGKQAADKAIQTTYDGRVGIGTTDPQAKLDVNGNIRINVGGSANRVVCWRADGKTLSYCLTPPNSSGVCACY